MSPCLTATGRRESRWYVTISIISLSVSNAVVIVLVSFVLGLAINMIKLADGDALYGFANLGLWVFAGTFAILLSTGIATARTLKSKLG